MPNLLGLHLQLLIGQSVPTPAPLKVNEALESVQVMHKDEGRSGFQLVFQIGRSVLDLKDYALLKETRLKPFSRVLINVIFGVKPLPISDGIITNHQLAPGSDPGTSKLTIIGEDVSLAMDLEKKEAQEFPNLPDDLIVRFMLLRYLIPYGVVGDVDTPQNRQVPTVNQQTPSQTRTETDRELFQRLAGQYGFDFYVEPGPAPLVNTARWGEPRTGVPQNALAVNMGPATNVETISFRYDELVPKGVTFTLANGREETISRLRRAPGVRALASRVPAAHKIDYLSDRPDGLSDAEARAKAQGDVNKSFAQVVTANGTLDALRYGRILKPRGLVDVRGAGENYNGTYYVKSVTHNIDVRKGEYKQSFSLSREGVGATSPVVVP